MKKLCFLFLMCMNGQVALASDLLCEKRPDGRGWWRGTMDSRSMNGPLEFVPMWQGDRFKTRTECLHAEAPKDETIQHATAPNAETQVVEPTTDAG